MRNANFSYDEPKTRIFAADRGQGLNDVIVLGRGPDGKAVGWSTLSERDTQALLTEHGFTPETVG